VVLTASCPPSWETDGNRRKAAREFSAIWGRSRRDVYVKTRNLIALLDQDTFGKGKSETE
jgi:hypothetical protein